MYIRRKTVLPNDDVPVYLSTHLIFFLKCAQMNVYYSFIGESRLRRQIMTINLMDYFPTMRDGYALKYAVLITLFNYVTINNLAVYPRPASCILDNRFVKAFRFDIADFHDVNIDEAMQMGIIPNGPDDCRYRDKKVGLNFLDYIRDNHCVEAPLRNTMMTKITRESYLAQELNRLFYNLFRHEYLMILELTKPTIRMTDLINMNLRTLIAFATEYDMTYLRERLVNDKRIKLFYAIIIQDTEMVREYVDEIDARDYCYEAYHLALRSSKDILAIVVKSILVRNWYESQVLTIGVESIVGKNNIPMIMHQYMRNLFS